MNCWPVSSESFWQAMRDSTSVGPPAGKRLMYLTGLLGQLSAARAIPEAIIGAATALPDRRRVRRRNTSLFNANSLKHFVNGRAYTNAAVDVSAANRDTSACLTMTNWGAPGGCRPAAILPAVRGNSQSARRFHPMWRW